MGTSTTRVLYVVGGGVENERDVVVKVLCREILQRLIRMTEPQRLVWWLRERIQGLGIDDAALAEEVRDGIVDPQTNGAYDARIKLGEEFVWIGLEQWEALHLKGGQCNVRDE